MNWDDLRLFLALAREESMTAAGKNLSMAHSTISRRMATFEETFRVRLFDRVPGGIVLTEAGKDLRDKLLQIEQKVNDVERFLISREQALSGPIVVSTSDLMVTGWLAPSLKEFSEQYPDIELRLVTSSDIMSLSRREIDVALRFTMNPPESAIGRKMLPIYFGVYGSKDYLASHEPLDDLSDLTWIGNEPTLPMEEAYLQEHLPGIKTRIKISNMAHVCHMVQLGAGIGLVALPIGELDPKLVRLQEFPIEHLFDLWILTHSDLRSTPRIRTFLDFMTEKLRLLKMEAPQITQVER